MGERWGTGHRDANANQLGGDAANISTVQDLIRGLINKYSQTLDMDTAGLRTIQPVLLKYCGKPRKQAPSMAWEESSLPLKLLLYSISFASSQAFRVFRSFGNKALALEPGTATAANPASSTTVVLHWYALIARTRCHC